MTWRDVRGKNTQDNKMLQTLSQFKFSRTRQFCSTFRAILSRKIPYVAQGILKQKTIVISQVSCVGKKLWTKQMNVCLNLEGEKPRVEGWKFNKNSPLAVVEGGRRNAKRNAFASVDNERKSFTSQTTYDSRSDSCTLLKVLQRRDLEP